MTSSSCIPIHYPRMPWLMVIDFIKTKCFQEKVHLHFLCNLLHRYFKTPSINAQCRSLPIKIHGIDLKCLSMTIIADQWLSILINCSQCKSMSINANQCQTKAFNINITYVPINANQCQITSAWCGIDRHWSTLGSMPEVWWALIGIGHWSRDSWYFRKFLCTPCKKIRLCSVIP